MDKNWIELVSKLETYEISPFEINKSIIEFAKALLELEKFMKDSCYFAQTQRKLKKEEGQSTLDFIDVSLPPSMQK